LFEIACQRGQAFCADSASANYNKISDALASLKTPVSDASLKLLFSALIDATLDLVPYSTMVTSVADAYNAKSTASEQYTLASDRCVISTTDYQNDVE
jgi:hypothetical protein